ncbi:MAG: DUF2752 domain-containing protein [Bacteroidota bacterium]
MPKDANLSSSNHYLPLAAVCTFLPFVCIALLPDGLLDGGPTLCPIHMLGGTWCPGCGMTRALWSLLHGDVARALSLNWRVLIVAPLLILHYVGLASRWAVELAGRIEAGPAIGISGGWRFLPNRSEHRVHSIVSGS